MRRHRKQMATAAAFIFTVSHRISVIHGAQHHDSSSLSQFQPDSLLHRPEALEHHRSLRHRQNDRGYVSGEWDEVTEEHPDRDLIMGWFFDEYYRGNEDKDDTGEGEGEADGEGEGEADGEGEGEADGEGEGEADGEGEGEGDGEADGEGEGEGEGETNTGVVQLDPSLFASTSSTMASTSSNVDSMSDAMSSTSSTMSSTSSTMESSTATVESSLATVLSSSTTMHSTSSTMDTMISPVIAEEDELRLAPTIIITGATVMPSNFGMYDGPCKSDSDCAPGLVCYPWYDICVCDMATNGGCSGGEVCWIPPLFCGPGGCLPLCTCNMDIDDNTNGFSNGCDPGEVCRLPCALADSGPECFADNDVRDCAEVHGPGHVCKDGNGDGVLDLLDGGSGCEEPQITSVTVPPPGTTAAPPGECSLRKFHPYKFIPVKALCTNDDDHPPTDFFFHDTAKECCDFHYSGLDCEIVDICPAGDPVTADPTKMPTSPPTGTILTPEPTLSPTTTPTNSPSAKPTNLPTMSPVSSEPTNGPTSDPVGNIDPTSDCGDNQCRNLEGECAEILRCFIDPCDLDPKPCAADEVCEANYCGGCHFSCSPIGVVSATVAPETTTTGPTTVGCVDFWHPSSVNPDHCTNDGNFSPNWDVDILRDFVTYDTEEECCTEYFGYFPCKTINTCGEEATASPTTYPTNSPTKLPTSYPSSSPTTLPTAHPTSNASNLPNTGPMIQTTDDPTNSPTMSPITYFECIQNKWHKSTLIQEPLTCTNDLHLPSVWGNEENGEPILFETALECCQSHFPDHLCNLRDICTDACLDAWHLSLEHPGACTNDKKFPPSWWSDPDNRVVMFFGSGEACCEGYYGTQCEMVDACAHLASPAGETQSSTPTASPTKNPTNVPTKNLPLDMTVAPTKTPTTSPIRNPTKSPSSEPTTLPTSVPTGFPKSVPTLSPTTTPTISPTNMPTTSPTGSPTSSPRNNPTTMPTNEPTAKPSLKPSNAPTNEPTAKPTKLPTAKPTSKPTKLPTAKPTSKPTMVPTSEPTTLRPTNPLTEDPEMVELSVGFDNFEGDEVDDVDIPWIWGDPPQWSIVTTMKLSGTRSARNNLVTGLGATSDLTLKIKVPSLTVLRCQIYVDIAMPFDNFSLVVNGERRNSFYQPTLKWVPLITGLHEGANTVHLRVQNGDEQPEYPRGTFGSTDGTGYVYIDICEILPI